MVLQRLLHRPAAEPVRALQLHLQPSLKSSRIRGLGKEQQYWEAGLANNTVFFVLTFFNHWLSLLVGQVNDPWYGRTLFSFVPSSNSSGPLRVSLQKASNLSSCITPRTSEKKNTLRWRLTTVALVQGHRGYLSERCKIWNWTNDHTFREAGMDGTHRWARQREGWPNSSSTNHQPGESAGHGIQQAIQIPRHHYPSKKGIFIFCYLELEVRPNVKVKLTVSSSLAGRNDWQLYF